MLPCGYFRPKCDTKPWCLKLWLQISWLDTLQCIYDARSVFSQQELVRLERDTAGFSSFSSELHEQTIVSVHGAFVWSSRLFGNTNVAERREKHTALTQQRGCLCTFLMLQGETWSQKTLRYRATWFSCGAPLNLDTRWGVHNMPIGYSWIFLNLPCALRSWTSDALYSLVLKLSVNGSKAELQKAELELAAQQ